MTRRGKTMMEINERKIFAIQLSELMFDQLVGVGGSNQAIQQIHKAQAILQTSKGS